MEQSMRRFMKVGLVLHAAYRGLGDGGGPILECLGKVVQDDYFDAVEVAHIHDPDVRRAAAGLIRTGHMVSAYGGQGRTLSAGLNLNDLDEGGRQKAVDTLKELTRHMNWAAQDFPSCQAGTVRRQRNSPFASLLNPPGSCAPMRGIRETCPSAVRCLITILTRKPS